VHVESGQPHVGVVGQGDALVPSESTDSPVDRGAADVDARHRAVVAGHEEVAAAVEPEAIGKVREVDLCEVTGRRIDTKHPMTRVARRPQNAVAIDDRTVGLRAGRRHVDGTHDLTVGVVDVVVLLVVVDPGPEVVGGVDGEGADVVGGVGDLVVARPVGPGAAVDQHDLPQDTLVASPRQHLGV